MRSRLDPKTGMPTALLVKSWKEFGQDGGTEASAWHGHCHRDENRMREPQRIAWDEPHGSRGGAGRAPRSATDFLFKDGLMAVILLGGLMLLGPMAWLLGAR